MITNSKQAWQVGQSVNIGFLRGLTVVASVPTPGDSAPDAYLLVRNAIFYSFVPHRGISRIGDNEAEQMIDESKKHKGLVAIAAENAASRAVRAAQIVATAS